MSLNLKTVPDAPRQLDKRSRLIQRAMKMYAATPLMPSSQKLNITISHSHRFIWYRVAKVATRSILKALRDQGVVFEAEHPISVHYPINAYKDYFKFAFIRSPWDRLLSCWKNKILDRHLPAEEGVVRWNNLPDDLLAQMQELEGFVDYVELLDIDTCDLHLRSQSRLIDLNHVDYVGRFESLTEHADEVFSEIGLSPGTLPKLNQSANRRHYTDYYDTVLRDRVARIYQRDIQLFNYSF